MNPSPNGSGRNLFDPAVRLLIEGGPTISGNPGSRKDWNQRPRWHGSKPGATANPEAEFAWPVEMNKDGACLQAPKGSRWHTITAEDFHRHAEKFGPECVKETAAMMGVGLTALRSTEKTEKKPKPYRRRRSTVELRAEVLDLHRRGLMVTAIANQVNVADRRVKEIIASAGVAA